MALAVFQFALATSEPGGTPTSATARAAPARVESDERGVAIVSRERSRARGTSNLFITKGA